MIGVKRFTADAAFSGLFSCEQHEHFDQ